MEVEKKEFEPTPIEGLFDASGEKAEAPKVKVEEVKEEEKSEEVVEEKVEEPKEVVEEEPSSEEKTEEKVEEEVEESPTVDWESSDNTYRKRFYDTSQYATEQKQHNLKLEKDIAILGKKLDGTYVEGEENTGPSPETISADADFKGRLAASTEAVNEKYGKEEVHRLLFADGSPFQVLSQDPSVHARVFHSVAPALEAMKIVREDAFFSQYGTDIDKIKSNIRKELEPGVREDLKKELKEKLKLQKSQPQGLGGVQSDAPSSEEKVYKGKTTEQIFG